MSIYFTLRAIPELADLPPNQRRIAWHHCRKQTYSRWQTWAGTVAAGAVGAGLGVAMLMVVVNLSPFSGLVTYFIAGFICGAIIVGVTELLRAIVVSSQIRPFLREYLRSRENKSSDMIEIDYLRAPFEPDTPPTEKGLKK